MSNHSEVKYLERERKAALSALLAPVVDSPQPRALVGHHLPSASLSCVPVGTHGSGAVRAAWVKMVSPVFSDNDSCYFTGTYADEYGESHGCMLARNVLKDFMRFLGEWDFGGAWICGVEPHKYRDILHLHAILQGSFTAEQMALIKALWAAERGHAKSLPVLDGCSSYITKYALKNDTEAFDWRLS